MARRPTRLRRPRGPEDDRRTGLALELARLDRLQETHWPRAMEGDIEAADAVLEIIDRKILLLAEDRTGAWY
jgi:hypothetical protein